jgi:hypothetical protein
MRRVSAMMGFMWVVLVGVLLMSGCQSTGVNGGVYGSDNLYGDPIIWMGCQRMETELFLLQ